MDISINIKIPLETILKLNEAASRAGLNIENYLIEFIDKKTKLYITVEEIRQALTVIEFDELHAIIEKKYGIQELLKMTCEQRDKIYTETYYNDFK